MGRREEIEQAIRRERARLAGLERERKESLAKLDALGEELAHFGGGEATAAMQGRVASTLYTQPGEQRLSVKCRPLFFL